MAADPLDMVGTFHDYVQNQEWTTAKKDKYTKNIIRIFFDKSYDDYIGTFTAMVKSGEIYSTEHATYDTDGYMTGRSDRSRPIANPCDAGYGPLQALQSYIFSWLKKHEKGFIHSYTSS